MRAIAARFRPNFVKQDFARPNFTKPKLSLGKVVWQGIAIGAITAMTGTTIGIIHGMGIAAIIEMIRSVVHYVKEGKANLDPYSKPADFLPIQNFEVAEKGRFRWIA